MCMSKSMHSVLNQTSMAMSVTAQNSLSQSANVVMKDIPLDLKMLMDARVNQSSADMEASKLHPGQIVTSAELQAVTGAGGIPSPSMDDHQDSDGGLSSSTSVHITDLHPHHHHHAVSTTIINVPDIHGSAESSPPPHNTHSNHHHHHQHHTLTELSAAAPHISIHSHTDMQNVGLKQQQHSHQSAVLTQASMSAEQLYASDTPTSVLHGSSSNNSHMQEHQSNVTSSMSLQAILDCNSSAVGGLQQQHIVTMPSNVVHLQGGTNTGVNPSLLSYTMSSSPMLQVSSASSSGDSMGPQSSYLTAQSRTDAQHDSSPVEYQLVTTLPYSHHDVNTSHTFSGTTYSLSTNNLNSIRVPNNINNTQMVTSVSTSNTGTSNCITPVVTQMAGTVDMSGTDILQNALISTNTVASSQLGSVTSNIVGGTIMHTNVSGSGIRYNQTNKQLVSQVIYRCFQCNSSFVSKKSLEDHMSSHADSVSQSSTQEMLTAASKEMDSQIMVMLNPIASSQPNSYESASPHPSYHLSSTTTNNTILQRPITSSHHMQHQLQQHPITVQHAQEHQQIVLQPHSEATNVNSCNKSRDYCGGDDGTVSQLQQQQQQQLYTVQSGQYQEQQQHHNNNNSVLITVPRNALTGNADINSMNSKNNVRVSNGGNICYQQQQQQQHHKGRRITATTSGGEVISVVTSTSGDSGGGGGTTTYVVASSDLHELQQSGGQLLLQKEDQQQETQSHGRGLNQRQVQQQQQQHAGISLSRFITTSEANISENQQHLEQHQGHMQQQTGVLSVNSNNKNSVLSNSRFQQRQQNQFTDHILQQQVQQQQITLDVSSSRHTLKSLEPDMIVGVSPTKPHRPYKCDKCTASFLELFECEEHRRKHSGDGPFTCEDCHFSFMYKSHFKSHKTRCEKKRAKMPRLSQESAIGISIIREFPTHQTVGNTVVPMSGSVGGGRGGAHGQRRRGNTRRNVAVITETIGHANDVYFKVESQGDDEIHMQKQQQQQQQPQQQQLLMQQQVVLDQHHNQLELRGHDNSDVDRLQQNLVPPTPRRNNTSNRGGNRKNSAGATTITINIKTQSSEVNTFNPMQPSFKRFKQQNNQLRPFECDLCDASFTTSDDLASHKMKHSSDGPFRCDGCRVLYLYRRLYDAHKRKCKRGRSKRDGPVGMGSGQTIQESQQHQLQESEQQMHAVLDQQSNHGQQVTVQQQQQVISVQQQHQTQCQQEQPQQIIFIEQQHLPQTQQQTKLMQQHHSDNHHQQQSVQQLDLSSLASSGSIIALQPHPLHQQQGGGIGNSVGGMQQFQIQTLGPGGMQVVDGSLLELRGQQLVAVTDASSIGRAAGGGGGQVKYEIVQAVDADSVPQIMNLIKKSGGGGGGIVATAQ